MSKYSVAFILAALVSINSTSFAAYTLTAATTSTSGEPIGYFGTLIGANLGDGLDDKTTVNYGLTLGTKLAPTIGVGLYSTFFNQTESSNINDAPVTNSLKTYNIAAEANYFISVLHVGLDLGLGVNSWSNSIGTSRSEGTDLVFIFGPEAGLDFPIVPGISLGAEAHYLIDNTSGSSRSQNNLQVLASLKAWL